MTVAWSAAQLQCLDSADEVQIAAGRADGTLRAAVPIWVVRAGDHVYVRTWRRRGTGWFGDAVRSGRARIRVPGLDADVALHDVGDEAGEVRAGVDAAYRAKYARYGGSSVDRMIADEAAATTLRVDPAG